MRVSFSSGHELRRVGPHAFVVAPTATHMASSTGDNHSRSDSARATTLWVSVGFAPTTEYGIQRFLPPALLNSSSDEVGAWLPRRWALATSLMSPEDVPAESSAPSYEEVAKSSSSHWGEYWSTGGMIDLSAAFELDPRAAELERRVVLSLRLPGQHFF